MLVALIVYAFVSGYRSNVESSPPPVNTPPRRTHCSVCGTPLVSQEGQYCSTECEAKLAKSMDDWHDRFEEMDKD